MIYDFKLGTIENNDKLFQQINEKLSIEDCMKIAQKSGKVCDPLNEIDYCPFFAYSNNNCFIGNSKNDGRVFNKGDIPVYPTPLTNMKDIKSNELMALNNIKSRLSQKKFKIDDNIKNIQLYIDAINENKNIEYIQNNKELIIKEIEEKQKYEEIKSEYQKTKEKNELITKMNELNKKLKDIQKQNIEMTVDKDNYINKLLSLTKQKITYNNHLFNVNEIIYYLLFVIIIIIIIIAIIYFIYSYIYKHAN
jgi:hypothetical protein